MYPELLAIARQRLGAEVHTPNSTESVVHECYLRLTRSSLPPVGSRAHFFALVSRLMRQVLVDHARARLAARRDRRAETSLDAAAEVANPPSGRDPFLLRLNDALEALAREAPEKAHLIELRFFGGLTAEETAAHRAAESSTEAAAEVTATEAAAIFNFLERHWPKLVNAIESDLIPKTNNTVELVIRRFDQHYQNFCGFDSIDTAQLFLAVFEKLYRLTPFSDDAQPGIRGKCPLELAGYDISQMPMTALCRGLSFDWPVEVTHNDVPK